MLMWEHLQSVKAAANLSKTAMQVPEIRSYFVRETKEEQLLDLLAVQPNSCFDG